MVGNYEEIGISSIAYFHRKASANYRIAMQEWRDNKRQAMPFEPMFFYYLTDSHGERTTKRLRGWVLEWEHKGGGKGSKFFLNLADAEREMNKLIREK